MIFKNKKEKDDMIWEELPILPIKGTVLFPETIIPILVGKEGSLELVKQAIDGDGIIGICALKTQDAEPIDVQDIYAFGTRAKIVKTVNLPDGNMNVILRGLSRIQIVEFVDKKPYFRARILEAVEPDLQDSEISAMEENLKNQAIQAIKLIPTIPDEISVMISSIDRPGYLADLIASNLNVSVAEKQEILEAVSVKERLQKVTVLVHQKIEILELGNKIQSQVKGEIDKTQREYYLREQLKAIQRELGEKDDKTAESEELKERLDKKSLPDEVRNVAEKELDRLSKIPPQAAEYIVSRTYLDWILELPWTEGTEDNLDIAEATKVLEEDHYDLEKVKKRILEYLAVRKLKDDMKGPILCFVGPPGVGKTSLGKSIARAMGRKFVRMSLGGIRDEAEIRGHRRTYVGALPGRIIQGMKKCQSNNPIFMLDEIDKLGMDFRGDPSSALLEVLDPEQNFSFSDHYLEVPFDLSKVMFIATANILEPIPPALQGQDGGPRTARIHRGREGPHRDQVPDSQADRRARPRKLADQDQEGCTPGNHQLLHTGGGCSKRGKGGGLHLQGRGQGGGGGPNRPGGHHEKGPPQVSRAHQVLLGDSGTDDGARGGHRTRLDAGGRGHHLY